MKTRHEPHNASETLTAATVESLSYDGRGVARVDGKTTFIEGALPGERVRFRYFNKHKNYDSGVLAELLEASPNRVTPPCPHFGTCGGCDLQHLRPEMQIQAKQKILAEHFAHIGKVQPETWLEPVTGPALGYRRRARLGARFVPEQGGMVIGFRERRKSFLAKLDTCLVLEPKIAALLPELRTLAGGLSCANRVPQIEVASGDRTSALVFRHLVPLTDHDRELLRAFGQRHDIQIYVQARGPDSIVALWPEQPEELYYRLPEFDVQIRFRPTDFIQINHDINIKMINQAIRLLELKGDEQVLDLFCGLGNFTLPLARRAGRVLGVEADEALIAGARRNAQLNDITNVEFVTADLYQESGDTPWTGFRADVLLLDPPRGGAMEAIKRLAQPLPSRIVYVSCYPATLARDSEYLVRVLGYRLAAAGVMDMFPQTSHVESMALFIKP
ncbi:MAG: 23S rRNA (uracil(1939)-C(5))-methyltransferase RlmD [Gammaproteobacteria bacterium]|nr:23S rRNA (uracil(1939)-C(5))-methyltransferase RlmD [Gammaproteobacteria bacterium]